MISLNEASLYPVKDCAISMKIPNPNRAKIFRMRLLMLEDERFSKKDSTKKAEACRTLSMFLK